MVLYVDAAGIWTRTVHPEGPNPGEGKKKDEDVIDAEYEVKE